MLAWDLNSRQIAEVCRLAGGLQTAVLNLDNLFKTNSFDDASRLGKATRWQYGNEDYVLRVNSDCGQNWACPEAQDELGIPRGARLRES